MRSAKGSITKLGNNRWRVSVEATPDPKTGKRRRLSRVVRGSRADAALALSVMHGEGLPDTTTWAQFWETVVEPSFDGLAAKTVKEYTRLWNVELKYRIGSELVSSMDWQRANEVLTEIHAPTVQRSTGRLLKKMCNMAIRDRGHLLTVNPVDRAIEYAPHRKRIKALVMSHEVWGFLAAIQGVKYEPLILAELGAGLRPEEARALTWEDITPYELKGATYCRINVDKALTVVDNKGHFKDTKNEASAREAICGEPFASRLLFLAQGKAGAICPSGQPYDPQNPAAWYSSPVTIAHNWKQWCSRNGVKHVTDENMRSSYASMMGEALAPDSVVAGNMGHSDGTTKGKHYQRVTLRAKCLVADLLTESLEDFKN